MIKPVLSGAEDEVRSAVEGTADWIIDLGPEGGDGGGEIVAWGTPEDIVKAPRSYTGKFLEPVLKKAGKPRRRGASEAAE